MRYRYRKRKRHSHKGMLVLLLVLTAIFLVSCVAGSNPLWVKDVFGLDVAHYAQEPAVGTCSTDGAIAEQLCDMVEILAANSINLSPFDSASQGVALYRDALLNDLLRNHYALYNGNSALLSTCNTAYTGEVISVLIPEQDFADAAARCFGATSVRHKSGELFEYRSRAGGYTAPLQAWECGVEILVDGIEETEHTWRMSFRLRNGAETSQVYLATFFKRTGGDCCFYALEG